MPRKVLTAFAFMALSGVWFVSFATDAYGGGLRYFERSKWMAGIGWSVGPGQFTNPASMPDDEFSEAANASDEFKGGAAPSVRLGMMLNRHLMVDANWGDWLVEFGTDPIKYRRTLQMWGLAATVYPGNPLGPTGGIYLRAGGGFGLAGTGHKNSVEGEAQRRGERYDDDGFAVFGEAGYEFWITPTFTAGLNFAGYYFGIDGVYVDTAWFSSVGLALNAHF